MISGLVLYPFSDSYGSGFGVTHFGVVFKYFECVCLLYCFWFPFLVGAAWNLLVVGCCGSAYVCSHVFQPEASSRPRRRRSRRPHEMQETLLRFALLVASMFHHYLDPLGGAGVLA